MVGQLPVAAHGEARRTNLWHSVFCAAAGLQFLHIAEHPAPRRAAGAEQQHIGQPMGIHLRRDLRVAEQRFQLGSKDQAVPAQGIEQRLDPDAVPRQKELLCPLLPHSKCKNTVEHINTFFTIFHICLQNNLRIGMAEKVISPAFERISYLVCIVKLSVVTESENSSVNRICHRLIAFFYINNSQTSVHQYGVLRKKFTVSVGTSGIKLILHIIKLTFIF